MQDTGFEDVRVFERFSVKLPMRFLDIDLNKEGQAQTYDISAKGLGLLSGEKLEPNTTLEMWLKIPDKGDPLYTRGKVMWSRKIETDKFRTGINLDKADLMGISRIMRII